MTASGTLAHSSALQRAAEAGKGEELGAIAYFDGIPHGRRKASRAMRGSAKQSEVWLL